MKTKLELAHEWAMRIGPETNLPLDILVDSCFNYAEAMLAEDARRESVEYNLPALDWDKVKESILGNDDFEIDWSDIPSSAKYWAMDKNGMCNAYESKPEISENQWDFGDAICEVSSFGYQGNWKESLRRRPE